jgi:polyribonucleotide 5'-hydroxyl-kinase
MYRAPTSALPIGASSTQDPLRVTKVPGSSVDLMYSLLAVSHADSPEQLASSNVAGFIMVKEVDSSKGTLTYMAPCPGALPGKFLLAGSFKTYVE